MRDTLDDSPARKAGLKSGDVAPAIGGEEVSDLPSAVAVVRRSGPGRSLAFRIRREGKEMDVAVKVHALPFQLIAQCS